MRIAIDGSSTSIGGGATYLSNLLFALAEIDRENEYIIICTQDQTDWIVQLPRNFQYIRAPARWNDAGKRVWWIHTKLHKLLKERQVDVLYSPTDQTSFRVSCPVVLGIQNSNPYASLRTAGTMRNRIRLLLLKQLTRISTWKSSKVIFVSNHSKEMASRQLGIPDEKAIAVYHGVNEQFNTNVQAGLEFEKYRPYILSVSTIYRHKNYTSLIRGFARLLKRYKLQYNLLIAGRIVHGGYFTEMKKTIADEAIGSHVYLLDEVKHTRVPELYAGARLFVFPSYRETFGLPTIEAMASGVPVVSSNASAMPEVCGDAALYFDPFDTDELAEVMHKLLTDDQLWEQMRFRGLERVKEFSWIKTGQKVLDVLTSVKA